MSIVTMAAVQNKLALQLSHMSFIPSLGAAAEAGVFETLPLSSATAEIKLLNTYGENFEAHHEKLLSSKNGRHRGAQILHRWVV